MHFIVEVLFNTHTHTYSNGVVTLTEKCFNILIVNKLCIRNVHFTVYIN